MRLLPLFLVLALAACGADGPPVAPKAETSGGIQISGEGRVGLVYGPEGISSSD
jgi:hypothetical protein